jgi:hypothetical protein
MTRASRGAFVSNSNSEKQSSPLALSAG